MNQVYPSVEEFLPDSLRAIVPALLVDEITERYASLGKRYVTDKIHTDGRWVNACMFNSSVQDAREEVVDAVFNTLIWIMKSKDNYPDSAFAVLKSLIDSYSLLIQEKVMEDAVS